jgi:putative heme transporter
MTIAFVTKDSLTYPVLVFCVYLAIQFIDNNFIIPGIVASTVKINALRGVSGMFLSTHKSVLNERSYRYE